MSTAPRVSIAIPTYNRADLVAKAIDSVLDQDYLDREVIVVDNGSTDGTPAVLDAYGDRIRVLSRDNLGRAGGRNEAILAARGELIAFLDSDDEWLPGSLARRVYALDQHPDVGMVHGHVTVIDEQGRCFDAVTERQRALARAYHEHGVTYAGYALHCMCLTSTTLVRRSCFEQLGLYDPAIAVEDLDLYLRLALDSRILFLDGEPIARYRLHSQQTGNETLARGEIQACHKHLNLLERRPDIPDARLARRNFELRLSRCHHVLLEQREARRHALRAIRLDPALTLDPTLFRRIILSFAPTTIVGRARRRRGGQ
jgi:glycosyltransferase involved in cell wall biosynthesis